jgi:hypothetical protein
MAAASAALLLDPLAEDSPQPSSAVTSREPASAKRGETAAPELAGSCAADAVAAVRALGLIAAIEGLDTDETDQHGVVVEQEPPAGTRLGREGIVVLRIGQPADELTEDEQPVVEEPPAGIGPGGAEDDTEAWFATLGPTVGGPVFGADPSAPRRRRKHRRAPAPALVFDTPPDPLPAAMDPTLSVSPIWRARALVVAGAILGLVIFARGGGSHSHHQGFAPLAQVATAHPRVVALPASALVRSRPAVGRLPRRRARRGTPRRAPRKLIVASVSARAPHAAVTQGNAVPPAPVSPPVRAGESAGQFSYLGQ